MKREKIISVGGIFVLFVLPGVWFGYQTYNNIKDKKEETDQLKEKQELLNRAVEFHVNGKDTFTSYNLSSDELKSLINFKYANKLQYK